MEIQKIWGYVNIMEIYIWNTYEKIVINYNKYNIQIK